MAKKIEERVEELEAEIAKLKGFTTDVVVLIDGSGSMGPLVKDTISGFNSFIDGLKNDDKTTYRVTAISFDSPAGSKIIFESAPLDKAVLTHSNYRVGGGTPLLDAVGDTVHLADKLQNVQLVIITDGEENSSRRFTSEQVKQLLQDRQEKKDWAITYLGANQDGWSTGMNLGIQNSYTFNANVDLPRTFANVSASSAMYTSTRSEGRLASSVSRQDIGAVMDVATDLNPELKDQVDTDNTNSVQ